MGAARIRLERTNLPGRRPSYRGAADHPANSRQRLPNERLREALAPVRMANMGRSEAVHFSGQPSPKQPFCFRPEHATPDLDRVRDRTFGEDWVPREGQRTSVEATAYLALAPPKDSCETVEPRSPDPREGAIRGLEFALASVGADATHCPYLPERGRPGETRKQTLHPGARSITHAEDPRTVRCAALVQGAPKSRQFGAVRDHPDNRDR